MMLDAAGATQELPTASLGELAQFINGYAFSPEDWHDDGMPIIRIQNLTDAAKPFNRTKTCVADKYIVKPGELLVSWSASLGVFEWRGPEAGLVNQHIFRVVPNTSLVDQKYLRYALEAALISMEQHLHGATMKHVNRGEFLATPVYVPSLPEQRRIATILDEADALRMKRRSALAQLEKMTRAIFIDMFGDPDANDRMWPTVQVGQVTNCIVPGRDKPKSFTGDIPWITTGEVVHLGLTSSSHAKAALTQEEIRDVRAKIIPANSVIMTCVGDLGRVSIAESPMVINQQLHSFQCQQEIDPFFLMHVLSHRQSWMMKMATQTTLPYMNKTICNAVPILLPPVPLQNEFSRKISGLIGMKCTMISDEWLLNDLFSSLQHRAFRGEL